MSQPQSLYDWVFNTRRTASVREGAVFEVAGLREDSNAHEVLGRLGDLGVFAGETFEYFGRAPLGEPIYVCVRETVVALRYDEARLILIAGEMR